MNRTFNSGTHNHNSSMPLDISSRTFSNRFARHKIESQHFSSPSHTSEGRVIRSKPQGHSSFGSSRNSKPKIHVTSNKVTSLTPLQKKKRKEKMQPIRSPVSNSQPLPPLLPALHFSAEEEEGDRGEQAPRPPPSLADYQLVKSLGRGSYGHVFLARKRSDNLPCALKIMQIIPERRSKRSTNIAMFSREVDLLASINHPFVIRIQSAFSNQKFLFMALDLASGGTLNDLFMKERQNFCVSHVVFYVAQLVLVLHDLHEDKIVFRDLKPANIMIDSKGYIKLIDFGISRKLLQDRCSTLCGTREFMAPEVWMRKPYDFAADWWSLGVTFYWMMCGRLPYTITMLKGLKAPEENPKWKSLFQRKITLRKYEMPVGISEDVRSLLKTLLSNDPQKRQLDLPKLARFKLFSAVDWGRLRQQTYCAPFIPEQMHLPWNSDERQDNTPEEPPLQDHSPQFADSTDSEL